jgi:hypothetical protein
MQKMIANIRQALLAIHAAAITFGLLSLFFAIKQLSPELSSEFNNLSKFEIYSHALRLGLACGIAGVSGILYIAVCWIQKSLK